MIRLIPLILLVLAAGSTSSLADQPYAYIPTIQNTTRSAARVIASVCKITVSDGPRSQWSGSGSLVATRGNQALILTCRHVCPRVGLQVGVHWPLSGQTNAGEVVEVVAGDNFNSDLSLVLTELPPGLLRIPVKNFSNESGPFYGMGWRGDLFRLSVASGATEYPDGRIEVNSPFVGGMSGGPMLNSRGQLIGVVVGSDFSTLGVVADGVYLDNLLRKYGKKSR